MRRANPRRSGLSVWWQALGLGAIALLALTLLVSRSPRPHLDTDPPQLQTTPRASVFSLGSRAGASRLPQHARDSAATQGSEQHPDGVEDLLDLPVTFAVPGLRLPLREALDAGLPERPEELAGWEAAARESDALSVAAATRRAMAAAEAQGIEAEGGEALSVQRRRGRELSWSTFEAQDNRRRIGRDGQASNRSGEASDAPPPSSPPAEVGVVGLRADVRVLIMVTSACCDGLSFWRRRAVRRSWGRAVAAGGWPGVDMLFMLAQPPDAAARERWGPLIARESALHGDLVVLRGADSYRSLPRKTVASMRFALLHPRAYTHVLKTDDDCYVRVPRLLAALLAPRATVEGAAGRRRLAAAVGGADGGEEARRGEEPRWGGEVDQEEGIRQGEEAQRREKTQQASDSLGAGAGTFVARTRMRRAEKHGSLSTGAGPEAAPQPTGRETPAAGAETLAAFFDPVGPATRGLGLSRWDADAVAAAWNGELEGMSGGTNATGETRRQAVRRGVPTWMRFPQPFDVEEASLEPQASFASPAAPPKPEGQWAESAQRYYRMEGVYMGALENRNGFVPIRQPGSKWYLSEEDLPRGSPPIGTRYLAGWGYLLSRDLVHVLARTSAQWHLGAVEQQGARSGGAPQTSSQTSPPHNHTATYPQAPAWYRALPWEDVLVGTLLQQHGALLQSHRGFSPAWRPCPEYTIVHHLDVDAPALMEALAAQEASGLWNIKWVQCTSGWHAAGSYEQWKRWRESLAGVEPI